MDSLIKPLSPSPHLDFHIKIRFLANYLWPLYIYKPTASITKITLCNSIYVKVFAMIFPQYKA